MISVSFGYSTKGVSCWGNACKNSYLTISTLTPVVVAKVLDCNIEVREFGHQSYYYVHVRVNTLGNDINPLIHTPQKFLLFFFKDCYDVPLNNVSFVGLVYNCWVLTNNENMYMYKCNRIFLFVECDACLELESIRRERERERERESLRTRRSRQESELLVRIDFRLNSRTYIVLKFSRDPNAMLVYHWSQLVFHWPWSTPMQCFFLFSLVISYTYAFLVSGNHLTDFI